LSIPTGLRIATIHNQTVGSTDPNDEHVLIVNEGQRDWNMAGWLLTDETDRQINPHEFVFPEVIDAKRWTFAPGERIFVMTGRGKDQFVPASAGNPPQFHFHWNRTSFVWNNKGDRVYLRNATGQFTTEPLRAP
jgi:hypothetical protein